MFNLIREYREICYFSSENSSLHYKILYENLKEKIIIDNHYNLTLNYLILIFSLFDPRYHDFSFVSYTEIIIYTIKNISFFILEANSLVQDQ